MNFRQLAPLGKLLAIVACLSFSFVCNKAISQVHGCTPESAIDRTGEATVDLDWDFGHSSCILVDPVTTVRWVVASNWSVHPLVGEIGRAHV